MMPKATRRAAEATGGHNSEVWRWSLFAGMDRFLSGIDLLESPAIGGRSAHAPYATAWQTRRERDLTMVKAGGKRFPPGHCGWVLQRNVHRGCAGVNAGSNGVRRIPSAWAPPANRRGGGVGWGFFRKDSFRDTVKLFCSDRKSTRLNSSHPSISYAVFCLKKKKKMLNKNNNKYGRNIIHISHTRQSHHTISSHYTSQSTSLLHTSSQQRIHYSQSIHFNTH